MTYLLLRAFCDDEFADPQPHVAVIDLRYLQSIETKVKIMQEHVKENGVLAAAYLSWFDGIPDWYGYIDDGVDWDVVRDHFAIVDNLPERDTEALIDVDVTMIIVDDDGYIKWDGYINGTNYHVDTYSFKLSELEELISGGK